MNVRDKAAAADDGGTTAGGISRPQLIVGLYLVGVLSGFAAAIIESIRAEGIWHALGWAFGISIVDVAATAVGVHLARQSSPTPRARIDYVAAAVFAFLIFGSYLAYLAYLAMNWPAVAGQAMTWAAVVGLAVYEMGRNRRCPTALAAASAISSTVLVMHLVADGCGLMTIGHRAFSAMRTL